MRHLKTFEQSLYDKMKTSLKSKLKKGGMYLITNSDRFKTLTKMKDIQQHKLDVEIKKYGEVYSIRGAASEKMVNIYNENLALLAKTIEQYINRDITADDVRKLLDDKIKEVEGLPTLNIKDAESFKKAAIDFLTWLRSDVSVWLI